VRRCEREARAREREKAERKKEREKERKKERKKERDFIIVRAARKIFKGLRRIEEQTERERDTIRKNIHL